MVEKNHKKVIHRQNEKACPCPCLYFERMGSQLPVWRMVFCFRWIKNPERGMGLFLGACLILPCLVPLVLWFIKTIIKVTREGKKWPHM
jgi:hypothetical protein